MTLYKPRNMVGSTIVSGSNFVHGTDSQINLVDAGDFESEGGYIRIDDGSQWALYEYTGINSDTLTGLSLAGYIAESTSSHTFEEGAPVTLEATADLWRDIVSILRGDMAWALEKFSNITGVEYIKSDIATNLSAGIPDRICFEEDTGRVLYDNGTSFVELGLSESEITLGNLGSLDTKGNSITDLFAILDSAQSSPPDSPSNGDYYMDDGTNTDDGYAALRQHVNGSWEDVGAGKTEEEIEDIVNTLLQAGDKLSWTYDSGAGTLTIDTTAFDEAEIEAFIAAGNAVDTTYDSGAGTLTIEVDESEIDHDTTAGGTDSDAHHTKYTDAEAEAACDGVIDAETVDGYDIEKDGAGGTGIINFLT